MVLTAAWLNAENGEPAYAAAQLRNLTISLLAGPTRQAGHTRSGVRVTSGHDLEVTLNGDNGDGTQVSVAQGSCVVDGAASTQGAYAVMVDEPVVRDVPAPHATLHRIDAVFVRVLDADVDASGDKRATIAYTPGDPASAPQPPVLPDTAAPAQPGPRSEAWVPPHPIVVLDVRSHCCSRVRPLALVSFMRSRAMAWKSGFRSIAM